MREVFKIAFRGDDPPAIVWVCRVGGCDSERMPGALLCEGHWSRVPQEARLRYARAREELQHAAAAVIAAARSDAA